jgi:hypothetical protein
MPPAETVEVAEDAVELDRGGDRDEREGVGARSRSLR